MSSIDDLNFQYPLPEAMLETSRVRLTPYLPRVHGDQLFSTLSAHPELTRFIAVPMSAEILHKYFVADPASILFAVIDKTKGEQGAFAGIIGLCNTSPQNLTTEIGGVVCFPEFQRTFVNTNAIGILLRYCLNLPKEGGLGFRRVQWAASPVNTASVRAAERMGMKVEGTLRWLWVLPEGKEGKKPGAGRGEGLGRDSVMLATYWDDWENGGREHVDKLMDRQS